MLRQVAEVSCNRLYGRKQEYVLEFECSLVGEFIVLNLYSFWYIDVIFACFDVQAALKCYASYYLYVSKQCEQRLNILANKTWQTLN